MSPPTEHSEHAGIASDQDVLRALAQQYGPILLNYFLRRIRDRTEAEDLAQEVFIRLLKRGNVASLSDLRAYLFETAASVLTDRARKRASHHEERHVSFDPTVHGNEGFAADRVFIGQESLSRAARAMLELPERTRAIFVLRQIEGLPFQDIADRLGVSKSTVEKHMVQAVAYLTQRMGEE